MWIEWCLALVAGGAAGGRAKVLAVLHPPVAAVFLVVRVAIVPAWCGLFLAAARDAPRGPEVACQTFVFVNGNDVPVFYGSIARMATGEASILV